MGNQLRRRRVAAENPIIMAFQQAQQTLTVRHRQKATDLDVELRRRRLRPIAYVVEFAR
jgi:hypothetical protein